ncbi:hypothetical protein [Fundicoccus culcitae]|uniref:Uncharacterized protein n=1 Tax=Fundicoccus culcitae TaxID=2969821 RepID=A0ABY5P768_9LACT|nr:hypothetical protein [Fundicoccus culcitae]UUX34379.1 hypothetical protein NRE15_01635 [Fundicoccus culcitae]
MEWWQKFVKWFQKSREKPSSHNQTKSPVDQLEHVSDSQWKQVPEYIPMANNDKALKERISLIAASVATLDGSDKQLKVTKIHTRNPEFFKIALMAASIAAQDKPDSHFIVKKIYKKQEA